MNQSQGSLFDSHNPHPVGSTRLMDEYSVGRSPFKVRLSELLLRGHWYSFRVALSWVLKKSKMGTQYIQLKTSRLNGETALFTPTIWEEVMDLEKFKARMEKYPNGTTMPNLTTQVNSMLPTPKLLKTPSAMDAYSDNLSKKEQKFGNSGTLAQELATGFIYQRGMLPTPTANDSRSKENSPSEGDRSSLSGAYQRGMLPTPTMFDYNSARTPEKWQEDKSKYAERGINLQMPLKQMARLQMLPTPQARDEKNGSRLEDGRTARKIKQGWSFGLNDLSAMGMPPTPSASDVEGAPKRPDQITQTSDATGTRFGAKLQDVAPLLKSDETNTNKKTQLSPLFVMEMMGFPVDWTLTPFIKHD